MVLDQILKLYKLCIIIISTPDTVLNNNVVIFID